MTFVAVTMNGRWTLNLLQHRAEKAGWDSAHGWEPERLASMAANIRPGMVVYDVGAEEGDLSALCATWIRERRLAGRVLEQRNGAGNRVGSRLVEPDVVTIDGSGGVVLIEAAPNYWPNIRATFAANELPDPLACWHGFATSETSPVDDATLRAGLMAWPAEAYTNDPGERPGFRSLRESGSTSPCVTIDKVAELIRPPDVITVDAEGSEIRIMEGAEHVLDIARPLVWLSVHPEFMFHDYGVYESQLHSVLHRHGYEKVHLAYDHEHHWFYFPSERRSDVVLP